jgi:hypothetical protein
LMENGGYGEHLPWAFDENTVTVYRNYVLQHHRLSAYLLSIGADAMDTTTSTVLPVDEQQISVNSSNDRNLVFPQPSSYSFRLGPDLLVHPALHASNTNLTSTLVQMDFPGTADMLWLDWWRPYQLRDALAGGSHSTRLVGLEGYAVYVRAGALMPLHEVNQQGVLDMNCITFTWFQPLLASDHFAAESPLQFSLRESASTGSGLQATVYFDSPARDTIYAQLSAHAGPAALALVGLSKPSSVSLKVLPSAKCSHVYEVEQRTLRVRCEDVSAGVQLVVTGYEQQ